MFKGIRIINIYVNSNEQEFQTREQLLKELSSLIIEANTKRFHLMVMGDFNADAKKLDNDVKLSKKHKYKIINILRDFGLFDTQKLTNEEITFTWKKNNKTVRRIDYIWINEYLLNNL